MSLQLCIHVDFKDIDAWYMLYATATQLLCSSDMRVYGFQGRCTCIAQYAIVDLQRHALEIRITCGTELLFIALILCVNALKALGHDIRP